MIVVGIDPGANGGICLLTEESVKVYKVPDNLPDLAELLRRLTFTLLSGAEPPAVFLEKVQAMRGRNGRTQGVASTATFMRGAGQLEGVLEGIGADWQHVSPQKWQKAMQCMTGGNKNISKARAAELFPNEKITHWKADAMLIALYGRQLLESKKG